MAIDFIPYSTPEQPKKQKLDFYYPSEVVIAPDEPLPSQQVGSDETRVVHPFNGIEQNFLEEEAKLKADQEKLEKEKVEFEEVKKRTRRKKELNSDEVTGE